MKKTLATLLSASMLVASMPMAMAAPTLKEIIESVAGSLPFATEISADIKVAEDDGTYGDSLSLTKETPATTVDFEAVLDTSDVKEAFDDYINKAKLAIEKYCADNGINDTDKAKVIETLNNDTKVTGNFTVEITVPDGVTLPDDSKITLEGEGAELYVTMGPSSFTDGVYKIKYMVNGLYDAGFAAKAELDAKLDKELKLVCQDATIADFGTYTIKGKVSGSTIITTDHLDSAAKIAEVKYAHKTEFADIATITIKEPSAPAGRPDPGVINPFNPKPSTPDDDDDKPVLNTEDHYGYIIGYPDGTVQPNEKITRAEVATIFYRMLTDESRAAFKSTTNSYYDVNAGSWFNNAISTLSSAGILEGYTDGTFKPNSPITRAELCKIAVSFYEMIEDSTTDFVDIEKHWAKEFIETAYAYGFIDGYPSGEFKPDQHITRAEAMKIVNRALARVAHKDYLLDDMIKWSDNADTESWYYADVQEATNSHEYTKDEGAEYEVWTALLPVRDWAALEK